MPNFTQCSIDFIGNKTAQQEFGYKGPVKYIPKNETTQISWQGCEKFCGPGVELYPWDQIANTITTWILPIIGIILQAPFESNAFWSTCFALFRWIGNPIASLTYILWNIKVTGRCALLVDMAVPYDEEIPAADSEYGSMRDSLYILTSMNQFSMNTEITNRRAQNTRTSFFSRHNLAQQNGLDVANGENISFRIPPLKNEGEGLLRIVLFSKDLPLKNYPGRDTLSKRRESLAKSLRENRKRGVVPVFISILWFLFALAISIESSFNDLGYNAAAHDLGIGLLLAWLPVLVLSGIVDRNSVSTEHVRLKLNKLIKEVCESLEDEAIREAYCETFKHHPDAADFRRRVESIVKLTSTFKHDYFVQFAGQGRVRWHYGAAQPILTSIERHYIAERGRGWLTDERDARVNLVLGPRGDRGLIYFDYRELFQVFLSIVIVTSPIAGAFTLSYWTPTVGFGCRSGGYTIFWLTAVILAMIEMAIFIMITPFGPLDPLRHVAQKLTIFGDSSHMKSVPDRIRAGIRKVLRLVPSAFDLADKLYTRFSIFMVRFSGRPAAQQEKQMDELSHAEDDRHTLRSHWTLKVWIDACIFKPLEFLNSMWLTYIVMAQGIGSYETCRCQASIWAPGGGYIDFLNYYVSKEHYLRVSWGLGTSIACAVMSIAMIYIVIEWCIQSHLSTENYEDASSGLRRTRQFRRLTKPMRELLSSAFVRKTTWYTWHSFFTAKEEPGSFHNKHTLVWTRDVTNQDIRVQLRDQNRPTSSRAPPPPLLDGAPHHPVRDRRNVSYSYGGKPLEYSSQRRPRSSGSAWTMLRNSSQSEGESSAPAGEASPDHILTSQDAPRFKITPSPHSGQAGDDEDGMELVALPAPAALPLHDQHSFFYSRRHQRSSSAGASDSSSRPSFQSLSPLRTPPLPPQSASGGDTSGSGSGSVSPTAVAAQALLASSPLPQRRPRSASARERRGRGSPVGNSSYYHNNNNNSRFSFDQGSDHISPRGHSPTSSMASATAASLDVPPLRSPHAPSGSARSRTQQQEDGPEPASAMARIRSHSDCGARFLSPHYPSQ